MGIVGLKEAIEEARGQGLAEEELMDFLLRRIQEKNYVPPAAANAYREALYKEYCKAVGLPVKDDARSPLTIRVLGPGCSQCNGLEQEVMVALSELGLAADLQHVDDIKEIASYGVMGTPALVINGRVVSVGQVPPKERIKGLIRDAVGAVQK